MLKTFRELNRSRFVYETPVPDPDLPGSEITEASEYWIVYSPGAIVELELDREIGKVPEEDFQRLFAQLEAEALAVIGELDQLNGAGSSELESRIEAEVAALRQTAAKPSCPGCGALRREGDRFCPQCGVALAKSS